MRIDFEKLSIFISFKGTKGTIAFKALNFQQKNSSFTKKLKEL